MFGEIFYVDPYSNCPNSNEKVEITASVDEDVMYVSCSDECNNKKNCETLAVFIDIVYPEAEDQGASSIEIIQDNFETNINMFAISEKTIEEPAISA